MDAETSSAVINYKAATLVSLSASLQSAIHSIPPHDQTHIPVIEATCPVSDFLSPDIYDLEQKRLFRKLPVPIAVSAEMPEPGSVMHKDSYGVAVLVSRDREGKVHAFLNACRHKGAQLVESPCAEKQARLTCPYHAWTFGLDGKLLGVPRHETFANFDKAQYNLTRLPCEEIGGLIWAILDKDAKHDFSLVNAELEADLNSIDLAGMHLYGRHRFDLDVNWKLAFEPFQEAYHVARLHASTVGPMFADVPSRIDMLGPHSRQVTGRSNYVPEMLGQEPNINKIITVAFQIFPATVIISSPYYYTVMIIAPNGVRKTTVEFYFLTAEEPKNDKGAELYARSLEIVLNVFGNEDFKAAALCQAGLETGAMDHVVYSGMESVIPAYQKNKDAYLKG